MRLFQLIANYTEYLAFFVSIFTWYKYRHTPLKYLPLYLCLMVVIEFTCLYFYRRNNVWLYNILSVVEFNFYAFIFWHYLNRFNRKWLLAFLVVFNSWTFLNSYLGIQDFLLEPISYSYITSYFLLLITIILLFYQILREESRVEGFSRNLLHWVLFGLLIFYGSCLPFYCISDLGLLGVYKAKAIYVLFFNSMVMYSLFIVGFLWSKKIYSY